MSRSLDQDQLADPHVALRTRLAGHLAAAESGALSRLAVMTGLSPNTLAAFERGAHLAQWAATLLANQLDAEAGE